MKNNSNIYDVDGELIRAFGDNRKLTLQEAKKKVEFYSKKLEELDKNDPKVAVYGTYIRNLNSYIFGLYSKMSKHEIKEELDRLSTSKNLDEQVKKAMEDLKNEVEPEENHETVEAESYDGDLIPKQPKITYKLDPKFDDTDSFTEIVEDKIQDNQNV